MSWAFLGSNLYHDAYWMRLSDADCQRPLQCLLGTK